MGLIGQKNILMKEEIRPKTTFQALLNRRQGFLGGVSLKNYHNFQVSASFFGDLSKHSLFQVLALSRRIWMEWGSKPGFQTTNPALSTVVSCSEAISF